MNKYAQGWAEVHQKQQDFIKESLRQAFKLNPNIVQDDEQETSMDYPWGGSIERGDDDV